MTDRPLRTVLVDDERLARVGMRRLLAEHPGVAVVGEADGADAARDLLAGLREAGTPADLVLLDVQMPGESGFDLLASLDPVPPAVVFVTAYDEHALRAFEVAALDYLVKPVAPARLAAALARVEAGRPAAPAPDTDGDLDDAPLGPNDRVFVKDGDRLHFVRLGDVRAFESEGNYVRLHLTDARPLALRSLAALDDRLDGRAFFRASRTHIVNLAAVVRLDDWPGGQIRLTLEGGLTVEMSRRQARAFRNRTSL